MNSYDTFYVRPSENELIETVVHIKPDPRPALIGSVVDPAQRPVAGALVCVYESGDDTAPDKPIGSLYTDETGQFAFGPLEPARLYIVRVSKCGGKRRTLE